MGTLKRIGVQTKWSKSPYTTNWYKEVPYHYKKFFNQFGKVTGVDHTEVNPNIDMLVLIGGADVWPGRYGEEQEINCGEPDTEREFFDVFCLPQYMKMKMPIFGICRGLLDGLLSRVI